MNNIKTAIAFSAFLSTALWALPSMAEDFSAGFVGNPGAASRFVGSDVGLQRGASAAVSRSDEGASRDIGDETASVQSFTAVGRTAGGDDVTVAPSEDLERAVKGELAPADRDIDGGSVDPLNKADAGTPVETAIA